MNEINEYTEPGFEGFPKVNQQRNSNSIISSVGGVQIGD